MGKTTHSQYTTHLGAEQHASQSTSHYVDEQISFVAPFKRNISLYPTERQELVLCSFYPIICRDLVLHSLYPIICRDLCTPLSVEI